MAKNFFQEVTCHVMTSRQNFDRKRRKNRPLEITWFWENKLCSLVLYLNTNYCAKFQLIWTTWSISMAVWKSENSDRRWERGRCGCGRKNFWLNFFILVSNRFLEIVIKFQVSKKMPSNAPGKKVSGGAIFAPPGPSRVKTNLRKIPGSAQILLA